jgi:hypothetical protein
VSDCLAAGWNDFALDIGEGYTINKCNSFDINLAKDNIIILHPHDFNDLGPINRYSVTKDHIFTKNLGRKQRNLFKGDRFEDIDPLKNFYFIINKKAGQVTGPFSESEFVNHSSVIKSGPINWKRPKNPNFILSLLGAMMTLTFFAIYYWWITIPFLILMILLMFKILAKKE